MKRRKFLKNSGIATLGLGIGSFSSCHTHQKDCEVLILGGGLSGLYSAMLLEEKGIDYKIIEGSDRIGGRLFTRYDFSTPTELGGVEVGDGYKRLVSVAKKLNVGLKPSGGYSRNWLIHFNGKNTTSAEWEKENINPLPEALKALAPYRLEGAALRGKLPFKSITDWYEQTHQKLDYPYAKFLKENGYDDTAIQLANVAANHNGIEKVSTLQIMRALGYRTMGGSKSVFNIEGGSNQLPQAMAKSLSQKVITNKKVKTIKEDKYLATVICEDGTTYMADKIITTIPFAAFRNLDLQIQCSEAQKKAINELPYTQITVAVLAAKEKFWETDELPVSMWSDTPIERVFAANELSDDEVLLKVFINGKGAVDADKLSKEDLHKLIIQTYNKIRPSTEDKITMLDSFSWGKYAFNKGAYAEFHAGQVAEFVPHMAKPTNRIYFAGEHTSFGDRGMEGAMASAERAVGELKFELTNQQ